jgi:hypothetical protein
MWLSLWVMMCLCRWSVLTCADGYDEGSADDSEEELEGCRLACGGVPVCHERVVLCFP